MCEGTPKQDLESTKKSIAVMTELDMVQIEHLEKLYDECFEATKACSPPSLDYRPARTRLKKPQNKNGGHGQGKGECNKHI